MQELITHYRKYVEGEKIQLLFMFQAGTVWASLDSVYRYCVQDERFEVCLTLIEETTVETAHMKGARRFLEDNRLAFCKYEDLDFEKYCPHVVFIQFPYDAAMHTPETLSIQFVRRGTRVVYVPYGIEISDTEIARKDHFYSFVVRNAWRIYTSCAGIKEEYDKYCPNRNAVRVYGSPKFDAICNKDELPIKREITELAGERKIVVWKMHFPKKVKENGEIYQITPYVKEYIEFAHKIGNYKELFFVILAHPKMLKGVVASDIQGDESLMRQVKKLISILSEKTNVYIDTDDEYRRSLYHADAIIMDRSAVMIEAAMLGIPVLLMKNSDYSEQMVPPVENVISSFCQGSNCGDMELFLENYREGKDPFAQKREEVIHNNFPFCDGNCGRRIAEDIVEGLKTEDHIPQVILYGLGEICNYYIEKQGWNHDVRFQVLAFADSDSRKWGLSYCNRQVVSPGEIKDLNFDAIIIMTEAHYLEIKKHLVYENHIEEEKVWRLDDFVVELQRMK